MIKMAANNNKSVEPKSIDELKESQATTISTKEGNHFQKPILVMVNTLSGRGKSSKIFEELVLPILLRSNTRYELFTTGPNRWVGDFLRDKSHSDLMRFRTIIVISGDGLLYETVNALMLRPDFREAMSIPLGIVPSGSGNGLAYTLINQLSSKVADSRTAVRICCEKALEQETCLSDLVRITFGEPSTTIWSFLSIGWGLLADIDIDSEWLRSLGELRFTAYGLLRSVTARSRPGRLSYRMAATDLEKQQTIDVEKDNKTDSKQLSGQQSPLTTIEDKFACVYAVHQTHISRDSKFAPKSTLTDQLIYLTYIRGKLTVCQVIQFLLATKDGSHDKLPYVTVVPVKSFQFEPLEESKIVVDGEKISWSLADGPIAAEVAPSMMKLAWSPL